MKLKNLKYTGLIIKSFIQGFKIYRKVDKVVKKGGYYTSIEELPIYNFFKIKKGEYKYLWIDNINKEVPIHLFRLTFREMYYQFKVLDNEYLREKATLAEYDSKFVRTGNYRWKNEFNTLEMKLKKKITKEFELDDFTDMIEHTFNQPVGSMDVHKVSTSKAFNNFHKAIALNKQRNGKNNRK